MSAVVSRPARLYRALALAEMVTWTLLLLGMAGKYLLDLGEVGSRIGGGVHGFVFLAYCLVTVLIAVDQRWTVRDLALGLGSSVLPYATVPFERYAERRDLLGQTWRLHAEEPGNGQERLVGLAVRRPIQAGLIGIVTVTVVFAALLSAGPPTRWFS
ncbi:integral membrane protein [Austwickia chelonae]|uniref:DUF3817 domain-containing protein n=1 Tax=Austwickia chelonae NBRC 105200 TaxID=1184607 RepID=K6VUY1_9MICO|nr:DUF3817 domain-containing protein [Austwickia chelonae]GAB79140.1 hypothetical protein AUCHE_20_00110 [Austwickia chelonae NBRC 105200]SEW42605.1 integral membrane protein [Austwickia chelonae]